MFAKLPLVTLFISNLTRLTAVVCMKVRFEAKVTRGFSLSSSLSRLVVAASRLALDLFREEKSRKTSGTRVMKKWNLIQNQPFLRQIFKEPPIISYKKGKSLKDMLVRAKILKSFISHVTCFSLFRNPCST